MYNSDMNSHRYECLNRLQIARLTTHPTPGVLFSLTQSMTPKQSKVAQRLLNQLRRANA